ncbi:hypothetical protein COCOBI_08-0700 [Coccomyxa sp. Obi]|nr:hypothetical protein COCOBI_08-0700 [Coccomyxa sp. Obi]
MVGLGSVRGKDMRKIIHLAVCIVLLGPLICVADDYIATLDGLSVVPPLNTTNNGTALFTFKEASLILPLVMRISKHPLPQLGKLENHTAVMYYQINITAPGGARAAELHQANSQDPLNTNGDTCAILWGPHDRHQDKPVDGQLGVGKLTNPDLFGPLKGLGIINLKDKIDNGDLIYLVILTKDHPDGELRGQLESAEPPPDG